MHFFTKNHQILTKILASFCFIFLSLIAIAQPPEDGEEYEVNYRKLTEGTRGSVSFEKYEVRYIKINDDGGRDVYVPAAYKKDRDKDGVYDTNDHCPTTVYEVNVHIDGEDSVKVRTSPRYILILTKNGVKDTLDYTYVDEYGCLPDRDGDGIPDVNDVCPDEPGSPEERGCPIKDTDGDGIPDKSDDCPEIPGIELYNGCPDTDGDKIPDPEDDCPEVFGVPELNGCPDEPDEEDLKVIEAASKVQFEPNSDVINSANAYVLDDLLSLINEKFPNADIELIGHTDSYPLPATAAFADNQELSEARAKAVKNYLVEQGITEKRITALGKGETDPIDSNDTSSGRANNRRVEINVKPKPKN